MDITTNPVGGIPPSVYCDWLDVTFDPDCGLWNDTRDFFSGLGAVTRQINDKTLEYRLPTATWGNFQLTDSGRGWGRLSASGGSCEALRGISAFNEYLHMIGYYPHSVTRLDACFDIRVPAPPIIQSLVSRYPPESKIYLTRKGVPPDYNLQPCLAGGLTGTFYAGRLDRCKAKVGAKVYDKEWERLNRAGEVTGPWTRYEVTARKSTGVTLRDASDPTSLFWHFASPALLNNPLGKCDWVPFTGDTWSPGRITVDPYARLRKRVENSPDLENLIRLADELTTRVGGEVVSDGRNDLLRLIRNRLGLRDVSLPSHRHLEAV